MSVTALQDWLSIRTLDPRNLGCHLRDAFRGDDSVVDVARGHDATAAVTLIKPGIERC